MRSGGSILGRMEFWGRGPVATAMVAAFLLCGEASAAVIADWTFETTQPATAGPFSPETGAGSALGNHAGASTYSTPAGNGSSHSFSSNTWSVGDYYQFEVSAQSFQNLSVSFDQTSSNTGPKNFSLEYSTDGTNFTVFNGTGGTYSVQPNSAPNTAWNATTYNPLYTFSDNLSTVTALNNASTVYLRLLDNSMTSAGTAGGTVAPAGTDRVDNFVINGTPITYNPNTIYWAVGSGSWDTTTTNWTLSGGSAVKYFDNGANGDNVNFTTAGAIAISPTAVTPDSITVSNSAGTVAFTGPGVINGGGGLAKSAAGTLDLTSLGANGYTGGTSISGGLVIVSNDNQLGATSGSLSIGGGTLQTNGAITSARNVTLTSSTTGAFNVPSGITTLSGTISGGGALAINGPGTLTLANAASNSYTGGTIVNSVILAFSNDNQLGAASGPLSLSGGTLQPNAGIASSRTLAINAAGGTFNTNTFNSTLSGPIQGSGAFLKTGSGTLTLTASSNYNGAATVDTGTLSIGGTGSINGAASLTINGPTAAFNYNSATPYSGGPIAFTQGTISGSGAINKAVIASANTVLSPGNSVGTQAFTAGLTLGGGGAYNWEISNGTGAAGASFDQLNVSNLSLSGLAASPFTIAITGLAGGSGTVGAIPNFNASLSYSWPIITTTAGITGYTGSSQFTLNYGNFTNDLAGGSFSVSSGSNDIFLNFNPAPTYSYWVGSDTTRGGGGTWQASGGSAWAATNADVSGGTWNPSNTAVFGGAVLTSSVTAGGSVSAANGILFNSDGYTINGGTINLTAASQASNSIGVNTGTAIIGSTLAGSAGMTKTGVGALVLTGNNTYTGDTVVSGGTLQVGGGGTSGSITGNANLNNSAVLVFNRSDNTSFAGAISGTGSVAKFAAGTLALQPNNTYTGKTAILGGLIATSDESAFGANPAGLVPDQITLNGGGIQASGGDVSFSSNRGITLGPSGGTLDTNGNNISVSSTNPIAGPGSLVKKGLGTLALNASNTFTGGLTINDGTVQLGHSAALNDTTPNSVAFAANAPATAKLQLNGYSVTVGGLTTNAVSPGAPIVENGGGSDAVLTVNQAAGSATYGGTLQDGSGGGILGITKTGSGQLVLAGTNSHSGPTNIQGGTLRATNNSSLGSAAATVTVTDGSLLAQPNVTISNPIAIPAQSIVSGLEVGWDFSPLTGGADNFGPSPYPPTTLTGPNISVDGLTRGNIGTTGTGGAHAWGGNNFSTSASNEAMAISASNYVTFTITPSAGTSLSLANLAAYNIRHSATGPTSGIWQYQIGGGAFTDIGSSLSWGSVTSSAGNPQPAIPLSSIPGLQGTTSAAAVTFRLVSWGATSNDGTWYLNDPTNTSANDLDLQGTVTTSNAWNPVIGSDSAGKATFSGNVALSGGVSLTAVSGGTVEFSGNISSDTFGASSPVVKTGNGLVILSGSNNTYAGGTLVNAGLLLAANGGNGSATGSGPVTVAAGASLGNSPTLGGTIGGSTSGVVTVTGSGILIPGGAGTAGLPLNIMGGLALGNNSIVNFDFAGGGNTDQILVAGTLNLPSTGTVTINLNDLGGLTDGLKLFGFSSLNNWSAARLVVGSAPGPASEYSFVDKGTEIDLQISSGVSNLTWTGVSSGAWDVLGAQNFSKAGVSAAFHNGDNVFFTDSGQNTSSIVISGTGVTPGSVEFDNTAGNAVYSISGAPISGSTGINILGGGLVTLGSSNSFTGPVAVSNGTLAVTSPAAVGSASGVTLGNPGDGTTSAALQFTGSANAFGLNITLAAATSGATRTIDTGTNTVNISGQISGGGGLIKTGAGVLALNATASYSGGTTLNSGTIALGVSNGLPVGGAVALSNSNPVQLQLNGNSQTLGALSSAGSAAVVDLGSGGSLTFGDSSNQVFAGVFQGSGIVTKTGNGAVSLTGVNSFTGTLSVAGGAVNFANDGSLGAASGAISLDNSGTLNPSGDWSDSRAISVGGGGGVLNVAASHTATLGGQIAGGGTLYKTGPGVLALTGSTNSFPNLTLSAGTVNLAAGSFGSVPGTVAWDGSAGTATLTFAGDMSLQCGIGLPPSTSAGFAVINTNGHNVTISGNITTSNNGASALGIQKLGAGKLTIAGLEDSSFSSGTIRKNSVVWAGTLEVAAATPAGYTAFSYNDLQINTGATFQLTGTQSGGLQFGQQDDSLQKPYYLSFSTSSTFAGSGTASLVGWDMELATSGSGTLATQAAGDVLTLSNLIKSYGPGSSGWNGTTHLNNPSTITVSGPGRVVLQGSDHLPQTIHDSSSSFSQVTAFGGDWQVNAGILQVGPFAEQQSSPSWFGPYGQPLNALGYKTVFTQAGSSTYTPEPDLPNKVTLNAGGMLAVAVDQVNTSQYADTPANPTPNYLRNPIFLNGGTIAATGFEADLTGASGTIGSPTSTEVVARLGGDFSLVGGTSTIATYDPVGNTGARTVQLVGGSRTLANATAYYAMNTTLTYSTAWSGTLNVDGGTAGGGEFDLFRDASGTASTVSVASGARINILNGATVNVGGTEQYGTLSDGTNSVNISGGNNGGHLVFSRTASLNYSGNISGNLDLKQEGSGLLVLSGSNTYTKGTYVENGTLEITSASALPQGYGLIVGAGGTFSFDPAVAAPPLTSNLSPAAGTLEAVPEPASLALLLTFAACAGGICWRQRLRADSTRFE
jgi:fibronectin-binding autotransporter adhesin